MSVKSRRSSTDKTTDLESAFAKSILQKASEIAHKYHIVLEKNDRLGFIANSMELPNVYADGKTVDECYKAVIEALTDAVATMLELKQRPPAPFSERKRTIQVNLRLTLEEKAVLSYASSILGFSGLSDFIRNSALERVSTSADVVNKILGKVSAS